MSDPTPQAAPLAPLELLLSLTQRALRAADLTELGFVMANDTWHLLPYRQAVVFLPDRLGRLALSHISGLVSCSEQTPYTLWLARVGTALAQSLPDASVRPLDAALLPPPLREDWQAWWPAQALGIPLSSRGGRRVGLVLLLRDEPWDEGEQAFATLLGETWSHVAAAFLGERRSLAERLRRGLQHPRRWLIGAALALTLAVPVRMSALAPAEVIALQAEAIAAPMDGVVARFHVPPNGPVTRGQRLFSLDDTTLRNRKAVAGKALAVARADALAAQQKAFDSLESKGELASRLALVREREAELAFLEESLARVHVSAPQDGIFVYSDPNDWIGKPVATGERIGQIAQPEPLGLLMWLPVGDAINLEAGAPMRLYLQVAPLSSLAAELVQTSYQAAESPEGIVAYRVRGRLQETGEARIGLRGTAKVYGEWRPLGYWMLRRPLGALRQKLGL